MFFFFFKFHCNTIIEHQRALLIQNSFMSHLSSIYQSCMLSATLFELLGTTFSLHLLLLLCVCLQSIP